MSFAQSLFDQLMNQSYGEFASSRTTHKMRGVMRGVQIALKGAWDMDCRKKRYLKINEKFFYAWCQNALCVVSNNMFPMILFKLPGRFNEFLFRHCRL